MRAARISHVVQALTSSLALEFRKGSVAIAGNEMVVDHSNSLHAWVAYVPSGRVVGISKLARVVEVYAKRLQIQEKMTAQIANTINDVLRPQGVAVIIKASHHCMSTRGVHKPESDLVTSRMLGCFRDNPLTRQEFLSMAV